MCAAWLSSLHLFWRQGCALLRNTPTSAIGRKCIAQHFWSRSPERGVVFSGEHTGQPGHATVSRVLLRIFVGCGLRAGPGTLRHGHPLPVTATHDSSTHSICNAQQGTSHNNHRAVSRNSVPASHLVRKSRNAWPRVGPNPRSAPKTAPSAVPLLRTPFFATVLHILCALRE